MTTPDTVVHLVRHGEVHVEGIALLRALEALDLATGGSHQGWHSSGVLHGLPGAGELNLLDAVGQQECDLLAFNAVL